MVLVAAERRDMKLYKMKLRMFVTVIAVSLLILDCTDGEGSSEMPVELIGKWKTDAPKYRGCFIELEARSVAFVSDQGNSDINILKKIVTRREGESVSYTIHYKCEGDRECTIKLYYKNSGRRAIQLENQRNVEWTRVED
jgi:hypothetical protein